MSMPSPPPPEPPKSFLQRALKAVGIVLGVIVVLLLVGVGLIWATCSGLGRR
jgi:hypothetical protein